MTSKLSVVGRWIRDEFGRTLRGVNRGQFHTNDHGAWGSWDAFVLEDVRRELDYMKLWGINILCLYVAVDFWLDTVTYPNHRQYVKTVIEEADARGIYVIYAPRETKHLMGKDILPFPPYNKNPDVIPSEQAFIDYWTSVANELGGYSNVMFELWVEPHSPVSFVTDPAGYAAAEADWFRVVQDCINAVRTITDTCIMVQWRECEFHGQGPEYFEWIENYPLTGGNIIYTTRLYRYFGHLGGNAPCTAVCPSDYETIKLTLKEMKYTYVGEVLNKPLLIREIGANIWWTGEDLDRELEYFENTLRIFNEWGLGYLVWEWWEPSRAWGILNNVWGEITPNASGQILIDAIATPVPCFVATVAFGSPLVFELNVLRSFRDRCLPALLVDAYYHVGPYLAQLIKERGTPKRYVREVLNLFVKLWKREAKWAK